MILMDFEKLCTLHRAQTPNAIPVGIRTHGTLCLYRANEGLQTGVVTLCEVSAIFIQCIAGQNETTATFSLQ